VADHLADAGDKLVDTYSSYSGATDVLRRYRLVRFFILRRNGRPDPPSVRAEYDVAQTLEVINDILHLRPQRNPLVLPELVELPASTKDLCLLSSSLLCRAGYAAANVTAVEYQPRNGYVGRHYARGMGIVCTSKVSKINRLLMRAPSHFELGFLSFTCLLSWPYIRNSVTFIQPSQAPHASGTMLDDKLVAPIHAK
jgi:hypothetical protein